jgi:hypothetical protein
MGTIYDRPVRELLHILEILDIVRRRQRQMPPGRGVLPVTVQCFLDQYRAEQTIRRYMSNLARMGLLERVGDEGGKATRRGYRVAI